MGLSVTANATIKFNFVLSKYYVNDINVNNRIYVSSGLLINSSSNIYIILPFSAINDDFEKKILSLMEIDCNENIVRATIDGIEYEGSEIKVDESQVYVNGILIKSMHTEQNATASVSSSSATLFATDNHSELNHQYESLVSNRNV